MNLEKGWAGLVTPSVLVTGLGKAWGEIQSWVVGVSIGRVEVCLRL